MNPPRRIIRAGPEKPIVLDVMKMLRNKQWFVLKMHGNMYQAGFPDLYCTHVKYKIRLIEVKDPNRRGEVFTNAQRELFPLLSANGSPVYVLTGATEDDYMKLFRPENWWQYLNIMR